MQRLPYLLISLLCFGISCRQSSLNLPAGKVTDFLLEYGKANPEKSVLIQTSMGDITLRLYDDTPLHRANFIRLIKNGFYNNGNFYRIIRGFMIQGGNPDIKKLNFRIPAEIIPTHFHQRGALAMARYDDNNPGKESSATEFYIVHGRRYLNEDLDDLRKSNRYTPEQLLTLEQSGGTASLDGQYTVFGEVVSGMEVVDKIASVKTHTEDAPLQTITFSIKLQ